MDLGIKDRVAIVTGGSRGLGRMSALSLAREGVKVSICGRTQSTLDSTVAELTSLGVWCSKRPRPSWGQWTFL